MHGTLLFVLLSPLAALAQTCPSSATPSDFEGPFYVAGSPATNRLAPEDQLSDPSNVLVVKGTVYGDDCVPMSNVLVEPWYAGAPDENGDEYSVAGSSLLYRAQITTDECGNYEYTSTFPISYSGRPIRHIHYRISDERILLTTQLYFEGHINSGFNPDPSQIGAIQTDDDGTRRVTFDVYVDGAGTANATACGVNVAATGETTPTSVPTETNADAPTPPNNTDTPSPSTAAPAPSSAARLFHSVFWVVNILGMLLV